MAGSSDASALFFILGGSLVAGYVGHVLFKRYRVSDILFLLGVGVVAGPLLGLVDPAPLRPAFAVLAPLALAVVLFEGGLELGWEDMRRYAGRAITMSLAVWVATAVAVTFAAIHLLGLPPALAVLFAVIVCATGILAVIPLLGHLRAPPEARVLLTVETSLGDLLSAVAATAIASVLALGASPWEGAGIFGMRFLVGASVGVLAGIATARVLHAIDQEKHGYAVVLACVLLAYVAAEAIGGSGFLMALTLGLFIGNARALMTVGGLRALAPPARTMRLHQNEIIFILRSVYFVYLGLSIAPEVLSWPYAVAAAGLAATMFAARLVAVTLAHPVRAPEDRRMQVLLVGMMPRGLAAAVLATVPAAMGVPGTEAFVTFTFLAIVGADVVTTVALLVYERMPPGAPVAGREIVEPLSQPDAHR